ncbi:MAG: SUMF1/EgtB/PvdO family nonheme iron enzyme [Desulfobacteraceae bacterium]|nr:SUMF1/EgtB/PvdO family nonheme iron enzyme [Desulfobacteraceae bacterium]
MSSKRPRSLREYLESRDKKLSGVAENLWRVSEPIHGRQNYPDSNENGLLHLEKVENNIWRLLISPPISNTEAHLEKLSNFEIFILSCAACCHDFDKGLNTALPKGFVHGEGSGEFLYNNQVILGLTRTQAKAVQTAVSLHDLKDEEFRKKWKKLSKNHAGPDETYNPQVLALLLKTADILHCDNSRVLSEIAIKSDKLEGLDRKKYLFRNCTEGWKINGSRIVIQVDPTFDEEKAAASECFTFMKKMEWSAVSNGLEQYDFPYELEADLEEDDSALMHEYLKSVITETQYIDIKGIFSRSVVGRESIHFSIEEIYTPITTHAPLRDTNSTAEILDMNEQGAEKVLLTSMLAKKNKLLITADPGGGKTTFLKFMACVLAKDVLGRPETGREEHLGLSLEHPAPVPVFLRLAGLADVIGKGTKDLGIGGSWKWVIRAVEQAFGKDESMVIQNLLEKGQCALLLDGLDEVADESMQRKITEIINSVLGRFEGNVLVISSRPFGFNDIKEIETVHIDAFGEKEVSALIDRWAHWLYLTDKREVREQYISELRSAIIDSPAIRRLAKSPVMLTCICMVHWNERRIPVGKTDLLATILRWLLNAREDIRKYRGVSNIFAEECFKSLALAMTCHRDGIKTIVDIAWAADQLTEPFKNFLNISDRKRIQCEGRQFLETEMLDSRIIEKFGTGQIRFWHLNFQEHYTAKALVDRNDEAWWEIILPHLYDKQWLEVLDQLAGCLARTGRYRLHFLVEKVLATIQDDDFESTAKSVRVLSRILEILNGYDYKPPERLGWEKVQNQVMNIFKQASFEKIAVEKRIAAAEAIGLDGAPRIKVLKPEMLPIPGMNSVLLGKYPVTVAEFQTFVENQGYQNKNYWQEGWEIKKEQEWSAPGSWENQMENRNRPVTGVSWYEACAYCNWLSEQTNLFYRLPRSQEWETAAVHPGGGDYPWGRKEPNTELLNYDRNVGNPTPVGFYPSGSAYGGHFDMAGNVWEWNLDDADENRVYRIISGGSWDTDARFCRSNSHYHSDPSDHDFDLVGFRLSRKGKKIMKFASTFLSHSSADKPMVEAVANELARHGIIAWLDKNELDAGVSLSDTLSNAILQQTTVTLFLSSTSVKSSWVKDELSTALQLEDEPGLRDKIIPIFIGDPLQLVSSHELLRSRWLHPDGDRVDRLGIEVDPDDMDAGLTIDIAEQISNRIYKILNIGEQSEIQICLDQRGSSMRRGIPVDIPDNLLATELPTLVFRPDLNKRSQGETLTGNNWISLVKTMIHSLEEALGSPRWASPKKIRIFGGAQLALPFVLGQYFNRNTSAHLFCTNMDGTTFNNQHQPRHTPLEDGNPHCETPQERIEPIADDTKTDHASLLLSAEYLVHSVADYLSEHSDRLPLLWVKSDRFTDNSQVMDYIADVVALLLRLREQHGVRTINLFCGLPFHIIPLLAANLLHVVDNINFMEYRRDLQGTSAGPGEMYEALPIKI